MTGIRRAVGGGQHEDLTAGLHAVEQDQELETGPGYSTAGTGVRST